MNLYSLGFGALQAAFTSQDNFDELIFTLVEYGKKVNKRIVIDTARVYGECETMLGNSLRKLQQSDDIHYLFIVVKIGIEFNCETPYHLSQEELSQHLNDSLERLGLNKVDCVMLHRLPHNHEHFKDALNTLYEFKQRGFCDYIGLSEVSAKTIKIANVDFLECAFSPFFDNDAIIAAEEKGITILAYSSIIRGVLNKNIIDTLNDNIIWKMNDNNFREYIFDSLNISEFEKSIGYFKLNVIKKNMRIIINFIQWCDKNNQDYYECCLDYIVSHHYIPIPGTTKTSNLLKILIVVQYIFRKLSKRLRK